MTLQIDGAVGDAVLAVFVIVGSLHFARTIITQRFVLLLNVTTFLLNRRQVGQGALVRIVEGITSIVLSCTVPQTNGLVLA